MEFIAPIIEILASLNLPNLIIMGVILYYSLPKVIKSFKQEDITKLISQALEKDKYIESQIREYLTTTLDKVRLLSKIRAREIIFSSDIDEYNKQSQYKAFCDTLDNNIDVLIYRQLNNYIRYNHFIDLDRNEYELYIDKRSKEIITLSRQNIKRNEYLFPDLKDSEDERMSLNEVKTHMTDIFNFVRNIKK